MVHTALLCKPVIPAARLPVPLTRRTVRPWPETNRGRETCLQHESSITIGLSLTKEIHNVIFYENSTRVSMRVYV